MEEHELQQLLQSNREHTTRGWLCPDDLELARYVGQQIDLKKRKKFEAHVAGCSSCLQTIGFLVAAEEWPASTTTPPHLLARARDLARTGPRSERRWRWALAPAAAACVVLFVAFIFFRYRPERSVTPPSGDLVAQHQPITQPSAQPIASIDSQRPKPLPIEKPKTQETPAPSIRRETAELKPTLQFPREGAELKREQLNFSWTPLTGAISYEIKLATEEGALAYSETTTQIKLRTDTKQLPPGKYFVTVVAHMPDGRTARSRSVKIRLVE
jgi:hypothetical protein